MTVQELITALQAFPLDLEVIGYDGSGLDCAVSIYRNSSADELNPDGDWDYVAVSVD